MVNYEIKSQLAKIIKYVIQDANVFVISHKTGMDERFEDVIKFEKVKGVSGMVKYISSGG